MKPVSGWRFKGFTSWLAWRSVYWNKLGTWRLRLNVPINWLQTLMFGRDTTQF